MTSHCPHCGQATRDQAKFCPYCGSELGAKETRVRDRAAPVRRVSLTPGALLKDGDYRVLHSLTKGGMGAVYLAQDRRAFDRTCVIKQMLEYFDSSDPAERRKAEMRFQDEGRTLASLSHPGIPRIYAFFQEDGRYYIVMEHIQGRNLETFVTHRDEAGNTVSVRPLPQEEIIRYGIQACRVLGYLHGQPRPVVHQDIKPANLILDGQLGQIRLVDFGTARVQIPAKREPGDGQRESVYGTDGYAPPEQYRGKPEHRSDVYALAATLYHLLTDDDPREHPFKWPLLQNFPRELRAALRKALRADPAQRSTAGELRRALEVLTEPNRTLEAFTFPGNIEIRSVAALPTLCDEHWDAARSFLYDGDFQRWLRDINRHDLVLAADHITQTIENRDKGLEAFLHIVDSGLAAPKVVVDPQVIDLGPIARESALIRKVTVLNSTRGYVQATVTSSQPWVEAYPRVVHLWAGIPADIRVSVHAEDLPFRSQQRETVFLEIAGQPPLDVQVLAKVSLLRESWRLLARAMSAALPESWRAICAVWRFAGSASRTIGRPLARHGWLVWLAWFLMSACLGALAYLYPQTRGDLMTRLVLRPDVWSDYVIPIIIAPPLSVAALYLILVATALSVAAVWGALKGAWKSFFR